MRRFVLERSEDHSGVSGTGVVCEGCCFSNGKVAISWRTDRKIDSVTIYESVDQVIEIHGHGGRTVVKWLDPC